MSYYQNLQGKLFGTLRVIEEVEVRYSHVYWKCKCEVCGFEKTVSGSALNSGAGAGCNECINEERWSIKKPQRLELCVDYMSGMKIDDIREKYKINKKNKALIYRVLKAHGLKADRRNLNK